MVFCGMHTEIIPRETKCKKGEKVGACCIRASLVRNAMCVHIPALRCLIVTSCFPELGRCHLCILSGPVGRERRGESV